MKLLYLVESGESKFLVFDEMPDKISTKYGDDTIIGRIGGIFYDFLAKRNGRRLKEAKGGTWYDGWRPYCMMCNRSDRMVSEPYGFKCPQCGNMIGFNLKRLKESPLNNASKEVI